MILLVFAVGNSGCNAHTQTKISGNLNQLSRNMTVAILPVGTTEPGQRDAAGLLRRDLYASLKQSRFHVLERYIVDGLLKQNNMSNPEDFNKISPIHLGETLGVDAVLTSTMTKVKRSYFILHSSIELGVSATLTDTRTGEILWMADQTETDFDGIGKIPTGIFSALLAPINFVTNKVNLRRMTHKMSENLMALVKKPDKAAKGEQFDSLVVASTATKAIHNITTHPSFESQKASSEAYRFSSAFRAPVLVPEARKIGLGQVKPIPEKKPVQTTSRPKSLKKIDPHPVSFSGVVTENPPSNEAQEAAFNLGHARTTKPSPLPRKPVSIDHKIAPLALARIEPLLRSTERSLEPNILRTRDHSVTPIAKVKTPIPRHGEIKSIAKNFTNLDKRQPFSAQAVSIKSFNTFYYTVQVGAYQTQAFAKQMVSKLSNKGYNVFLTRFKKGKNFLYKVHIEKFIDRKEAYHYSRNLYTKEKIDSFVTKLKLS